jgi:hypothetical protein
MRPFLLWSYYAGRGTAGDTNICVTCYVRYIEMNAINHYQDENADTKFNIRMEAVARVPGIFTLCKDTLSNSGGGNTPHFTQRSAIK